MKNLFALLILIAGATQTPAALTWHWNALPTDLVASNAIAVGMNQAVAVYNTYSDYSYDIGVLHSPGTPTADAGYHGQIRFGGSTGYRVAMHEMSHWLGTGTVSGWNDNRQGGQWLGTYANNAAQAYDGPFATIGCDAAHYWPYGWNYDNEAVYPERLVGFVGGFDRDTGADEDRTIGFAPGTYRLRNRATAKLLDNLGSITEGAPVNQWGSSASPNQQWVLSLIPGTTYFTLRSVASGKYLDTMGNVADGSAIGLKAENFSTSQQWQVLKTDSGFYQIVNRATGKCLDNAGQSAEGAGMQQWFVNGNWNQHWKFVHVTPAGIPAGLVSQYQPATASSSLGSQQPANGNDGDTGLIRWTANGGAYPQWWRVDLGSVYTITNAITFWYPGFAFQYRIEVSTNDVNYTVAVDATGNVVQGTTTDNFSATARYVRLTATGINPAGGWASFYDCQIFGTPQVPVPPTGLVATPVSSQQINLSWVDQRGAASFNIKRSTNDGGPYITIAANVNGLSYADTGLIGSTIYYYVISAVNGAGESGDSAQAGATTSSPVLPLPPTGLVAMPGHSQVTLSWAASLEAASYRVKRATVNGGPYSLIGTATAMTYMDATAVNGTTYYYAVSATNSVGESADSSQMIAVPSAMFAHWKFNETSGTTAVDSVAARNGTLNGGAAFTAGKFSNAVALNGTSSYVSLPTGVVSSLSGNFSIAAWVYVNANGTWARVFDFGTGTTVYMYLAPVSGGNTVRYVITTSSSAGEQTINGPVLSAGAWHHVAVTLSGTTGILFVDGVGVGTNIGMTLKPSSLGSTTQNYIGKSQWPDPYLNGRVDDFRIYSRALSSSEIVALANPDGAPAAPTALAATPGMNQIALSWTAVPSVPNYKVKRALASGGAYTTIATATAANYTDTTAINGMTYYYVVSAANGAGESPNSPPATATPTDLLAYLKFNETSGTTAADTVGLNAGTLATGATWIAGKINNAVSLNGSSGYVSLPAGVVSSLNDFSISSWVYVNANATWARLYDFGVGTGAYMFLAPASGGNVVRYAIKNSGNSEQQINGAAVLSPGAWHLVVVTLTGTTGTLYVDGVAVGTNINMTLKPSSLGNTALNYLGKSQFADPYLNGRVDDFRIYRRSLSAAEVSTLFTSNGGVPGTPTALAATSGNGQVGLSWNTTATATSYKMKRAPTSGGPYNTIGVPTTTTYTDTTVANGTRYYYVVSAVNISGEGANSVPVAATPSSTAPVSLAMSLSGGALNLAWPTDHTGWRLLVQTNNLSNGLSLDTNDWATIPNSSQTNQVALPVDVILPSEFYRLTYP